MGPRARSVFVLVAALALASLLGACSGDDDPGDRGDPEAPVLPWPIPRTGAPSQRPLEPAIGGNPGSGLPPFTMPDAGQPLPPRVEPPPSVEQDAGPMMMPDPTLDQLDPDEVYILGTLSEGACYLDAIAPVLAPDQALVGFGCYAHGSPGFVRPADGRFVYSATFDDDVVYGFRCDGCTYVSPGDEYPQDPTANDERIPATVCTDADDILGGFAVSPDGEVLIRCGSGAWYRSDETEVVALAGIGPGELRLGHEGTALVPGGVLDLTTGELAELDGLTDPLTLALRSRPDGYWIAIAPNDAPMLPELWHVAFDGSASLVGTYPLAPPDQSPGGESELDGEGRLVQFSRNTTESFRDTIVRRSVEGESAVVYDEADDPVVKLHISDLFTGP